MSEPLKYDVICFGEVSWDILPTAAVPGGAPMNVALDFANHLGAGIATRI